MLLHKNNSLKIIWRQTLTDEEQGVFDETSIE